MASQKREHRPGVRVPRSPLGPCGLGWVLEAWLSPRYLGGQREVRIAMPRPFRGVWGVCSREHLELSFQHVRALWGIYMVHKVLLISGVQALESLIC